MNFDDAINAHVKWKLRLTDYLNGGSEKLDSSVIEKDDQCSLGQWIYGTECHPFKSSDVYSELKSLHADFHKKAASIVQLVDEGKKGEAESELKGEYTSISTKVITQIRRLKKIAEAS